MPAVVSILLTPLPVSCPLTTPPHYIKIRTKKKRRRRQKSAPPTPPPSRIFFFSHIGTEGCCFCFSVFFLHWDFHITLKKKKKKHRGKGCLSFFLKFVHLQKINTEMGLLVCVFCLTQLCSVELATTLSHTFIITTYSFKNERWCFIKVSKCFQLNFCLNQMFSIFVFKLLNIMLSY